VHYRLDPRLRGDDNVFRTPIYRIQHDTYTLHDDKYSILYYADYMNKIIRNIIVITFIMVITVILPSSASAATIGPVDGALTTVSATVGNPTETPPKEELPEGENERFAIYGYTSPHASVKIQSPIYGETKADSEGLFEFKYLFLALFREDLCIVAQDTENRSTPPLCIPPPEPYANKRIGPVLLPPSTSISSGNAYIGDSVTLTGQTIPNADVKLSMFTDELQQNKKLTLIPEAYAYTLPQLSLTSNKKGEYSLTLPTASSQFMRMFTRTLYDGNSTPKSLTLILDIFPLWMVLFKFFASFWSVLKAHIIEIIILTQLYFLLMYFLRHFFRPDYISLHRRRALAVIHGEMTLLPHEIMMKKEMRLALRRVSIILK